MEKNGRSSDYIDTGPDGPRRPGDGLAAKLVFSVAETAALLSVGRTTVYELIGSGALPTVKIGARRLVTRGDLEAFVAGLETAQREAG